MQALRGGLIVPAFTIEYQRDGILRNKFKVPARESGLVGVYVNGIPYQPQDSAIEACLPYHVRKAFARQQAWWQIGLSDVMKKDLVALSGKPLGTLFARVED